MCCECGTVLHMINTARREQNAKQVWEDLKWCQMQDVSSTHTQSSTSNCSITTLPNVYSEAM